jgi:hypothetical protein
LETPPGYEHKILGRRGGLCWQAFLKRSGDFCLFALVWNLQDPPLEKEKWFDYFLKLDKIFIRREESEHV